MISIDDILFPRATVNRLAKAILADGGLISKDSSIALQRSATVFVSHLLVLYVFPFAISLISWY